MRRAGVVERDGGGDRGRRAGAGAVEEAGVVEDIAGRKQIPVVAVKGERAGIGCQSRCCGKRASALQCKSCGVGGYGPAAKRETSAGLNKPCAGEKGGGGADG